MVKVEKEYVNASVPSLNRPEKPKHCEKCDDYERMLESERKSNQQLKKLIEQQQLKDLNKEKQQPSTQPSGPCKTCADLRQLLDIEKQNTEQLNDMLKKEKLATEEERNAKD
ncbi:unnamed protein product, partial [Didymodactylos carnosus]